MREVYPKWIIENNQVKIGKCTFHKEMCEDKSNVIGGGWYHIDLDNKILWLYCKSEEFGSVSFEDIFKAKPNGPHRRTLSKIFTDFEWRFSKERWITDAMNNYKIV